MPGNIKPIKRSPQLAPLSREHHYGLLFGWKIKQGIINKTSLEILGQYSTWYWQCHLLPHFLQEENILLPFLPASHSMAERLIKEHDDIKKKILALQQGVDEKSLLHIGDLITAHIRFEERELFNYLEEILSSQKLDTIFMELEKHPASKEVWEDEFWVRGK